MDERQYLEVISGQRRGVVAQILRGVLALGVPVYAAATTLRNWSFDCGLRRAHSVSIPVISVGNITTGGTGKTPMVAWTAQWFVARGIRPCLVSRGFRSLESGGNDELRVLAQLCPEVPHVQHRDRVAAAREAATTHAAHVVILDDGFQHRRLGRDLDIVLIDATNPWGYGHLLPRGLLRETRAGLRRADIIVLTRVDQLEEQARAHLCDDLRRATDAPLVEAAFRPSQLVSLAGQTAKLGELAGLPLAAFCGIGNPNGFRRTLDQAGLSVNESALLTFPDHHHYTPRDLYQLCDRAGSLGAAALVTTQKDLVKLNPLWKPALPVWAVTIGVEIVSGRPDLERLFATCIPETDAPSLG